MSEENPYAPPPDDPPPDEPPRPPATPPPPPEGYVPYPDMPARPRFFYLDLGGIIGKTFTIWWRNIVPFFLMATLIYIPLFAMGAQFHSQPRDDLGRITFSLVVWLVDFLLRPILTAAVTYAVVQHLRGVRVGIGQCLSVGFSRILPVLGVSLLVGLCVLGGFILLFVPGVIIAIIFYVAVPVAVIERPGVLNSLRRSAQLTKGYRWILFAIVLLFTVMIGAAAMVLMLPAMVAMGAFTDPTVTQGAGWFFLQQGIGLIVTPLGAIVPAVIYHDLRVGKEGADVEELAEVFD